MYSKLLITGGSGWLGRGLINALKHGMPEVEKLKGIPFKIQLKLWSFLVRLNNLSLLILMFEGDLKNPNDCKLFVKMKQMHVFFI